MKNTHKNNTYIVMYVETLIVDLVHSGMFTKIHKLSFKQLANDCLYTYVGFMKNNTIFYSCAYSILH